MPDNTIQLQVTITAEAEVTKAEPAEKAQEENEDER